MRFSITPRLIAYAFATLLAFSVAYDLWRMPLQVSDSVEEIVHVHGLETVSDAFLAGLTTPNYFRPLRMAQTKLLADWSRGDYVRAFKVFHVLLVFAAFILFVRALDVRTPDDLAAASFALLVFMGIHTFLGLVKEAYPVNHFLQVVVLSLLALNLAQGRGGTAVDVSAAVAIAAACLTLESGVLVWVILAAAWLSGMRGVSPRGLGGATLLLAAYVIVRLFFVRSELSTMMNRETGYLFGTITSLEAAERFGHVAWLYAYNIVSSVLSTVLSEPRRGIWVSVRSMMEGDVPARVWVNVIAQIGSSALVAAAAVTFGRNNWRSPADRQMALVPIFIVVLFSNALICFAYTKDEIISVAGAFYALAAFAGAKHVIARSYTLRRPIASAVAVALFVVSCAWGVRVFGVHHVLQSQAFKNRNDWAGMPHAWQERGTWPSDPEAQRLVLRLRLEAVSTPVVNPRFVPWWAERVFDVE